MLQYDSYTDFEITGLLNQGDEYAFRYLYTKYWDKLYVMANNRLNDADEAEEVVQDIFLNMWRKRHYFQLKKGFDNYLSIALKYEVINRRAKRIKNKEFQKALLENHHEQGTEEIFYHFDLEQLQMQLQYRINQLPEKCRLVFNMSRESNLTNKQIAETLHVSEKAIEKHITNALKHLRHYFSHYLCVLVLLTFT